MNKIYINNKEFRKYNDTYYISSNGEVYSLYSNKFKKIKNLNEYESVTTMGDECNPVE